MESESSILRKQPRLMSSTSQVSPNIPVVECVRKFVLPQTFPSMANYNDGSNEVGKLLTGETQKPVKLAKFTIKTMDGRELDMKIMPQNTPVTCLNGKTISFSLAKPLITTSQPISTIAKGNTLVASASAINDSKTPIKLSRYSVYQTLDKNPHSAIKYVIPSHLKSVNLKQSDSKFANSRVSVNTPLGSNIVTNPIYQLDNNTVVPNTDDDNDFIGSYDVSQPNTIVIKEGKGWRVLKKQPEKTILRNVQNKSAYVTIDNNNFNGQKPVLSRKNPSMLNIEENIPFRPFKAATQSNINNRQLIYRKSGGRLPLTVGNRIRSDHGYAVATDISDQNLRNIVDDSNGIINLDKDKNLDGNTVYVLQNEDNLLDKEKSENKINTKNTKQVYPLINSQGRVNLIRRGNNKGTTSNKFNKSGNPTKQSSSPGNYRSPYLRDDLTDEEISNKLSVVGEALSTVSDENLKARALRALAECGIGIERFIPKKPPYNYLAVKDSQTQTNIFGLLEKNVFVRVTGYADRLERLQETEKQTIIDNNKSKKQTCVDTAKFREDLDKMLGEIWVDKPSVEQVENLLKIHPVVEKAYKILERDLKNVNKFDENGLLNIHKAVLGNNERVLKKHIMMLKVAKEPIDILTQDKQTSLELAIQHSAEPEIVNLLLKNGANPVSPENARDSALTIASRITSDCLPQLVKYISPDNPAINNVDSEGFTALHHCARNGNYRGVMCLLAINADINARDFKSGRTALFHAFENESINICKELLTAGAKPNIPNFSGQTVISIFDEEKHFLLKEYFKKYQK